MRAQALLVEKLACEQQNQLRWFFGDCCHARIRALQERIASDTLPAGKWMNLVDDLYPAALSNAQVDRSGNGPSLLLRETFVDACGYVSCHFADPLLDAATLAQELRCSRATLYRAFVAHQTTVAGHIQRVRFQNVLTMFVQSSPRVPISSIAADCGFECLRHFSRRFKQVYGMTPGACRNALRSLHVPYAEGAGSANPSGRRTSAALIHQVLN